MRGSTYFRHTVIADDPCHRNVTTRDVGESCMSPTLGGSSI